MVDVTAGGEGRTRSGRRYLYEVDLIRIVTALAVVAVHVLAFTVFLNGSQLAGQIQNGFVSTFHYTREVFMFASGVVLTYTYYDKHPFPARRFWSRRGLSIVLPYALWSIFYVWVAAPHLAPWALTTRSLHAILTGSASYQLYYLLIAFEFYLILPWFLRVMHRIERHLGPVLLASFLLQVLILYLDFHTLQTLPASAPHWQQVLAANQDRIILLYQFYFILGAAVAIHARTTGAWLRRHWGWVLGTMGLGTALLWGHYLWMIWPRHAPVAYATSVLQPVMALYSLGVVAFLYLLGIGWSKAVADPSHRIGSRVNRTLNNASFGLYLVHPYLLTLALAHMLPAMPGAWPVALRVFLLWFVVSAASLAFTAALCQVPVLSRLVGQRKAWPASWTLRGRRSQSTPESLPTPAPARADGD